MIGESILPVRREQNNPGDQRDQREQDGNVHVNLAFVPREMPTITSCTLDKTYRANVDFTWQPGTRQITIPPQSDIPVVAEDFLYREANSQPFGLCRDRDNDIFFTDDDGYHQIQSAVTYPLESDDDVIFDVPVDRLTLPRFTMRLSHASPTKVVLLGDSISQGYNASEFCDVPPHMPAYGELLCHALGQRFQSPVELDNLSLKGMTSEWGYDQSDRVIQCQPDLVILAFGMNDGSVGRTPNEFKSTISSMINTIRSSCNEVEFVLVAPMTANAQWIKASDIDFSHYRDELADLTGPGVVLADVYRVWQLLLNRKTYFDLTGNGLNHPNDFGHRIYAQTIWDVLVP